MARWGKEALSPRARRDVPGKPCDGKAESQGEAALLRLVETLAQRLLGVSQTPQCVSPRSQRVGTVM